jgi:hypothetical protein
LTDQDKKSEKKQIKSQRLTTKFDFPSELATKSTAPVKPAADPSKSSPDAIFSDISALRKKYDDMVAYSVVLTGERDYLTGELEEAKQRIQRLEKDIKSLQTGESANTTVQQKKKEDTAVGFSFVQVMVMILVAFILGRVLS